MKPLQPAHVLYVGKAPAIYIVGISDSPMALIGMPHPRL